MASLERTIRAFAADTGGPLELRLSSALSARDRKFAHEVAERCGLLHQSTGSAEDGTRSLLLAKPLSAGAIARRRRAEEAEERQEAERRQQEAERADGWTVVPVSSSSSSSSSGTSGGGDGGSSGGNGGGNGGVPDAAEEGRRREEGRRAVMDRYLGLDLKHESAERLRAVLLDMGVDEAALDPSGGGIVSRADRLAVVDGLREDEIQRRLLLGRGGGGGGGGGGGDDGSRGGR